MSERKANNQKAVIYEKLKVLLKAYPNVLAEYPDIFNIITLNEQRVDNVMSLSNRQVTVLKDQIEGHNDAMIRFVNNAKHNEFITSKLFDITYELTACRELGDIFDVLYEDVTKAFSIDAVGIKLALDIPSQKELSEVDKHIGANPDYLEIFEATSKGKSICGTEFSPAILSLFFGAHSEDTLSAAFAPLMMPNSSECIGVIGLSSNDFEKFSDKQKQGTLHLDRLGKIVAIAIERVTKDDVLTAI